MGFLRRSGVAPELVMTDTGWQLFDDALADAWLLIAAIVWEGYQSSGRGFVLISFNPRRMDYRTIEDAKRWLDSGSRVTEFQRYISRYKPDREFLALVEGCADNAKAARAGASSTHFLSVPTPRGSPTPPEAAERYRLMEAMREYTTGLFHQEEQRIWERHRRALGPDTV